MSNLKEITVISHKYSIEHSLGRDWKFLACVCGLGLQIKILLVFGVSAQEMKGLTSAKSGL